MSGASDCVHAQHARRRAARRLRRLRHRHRRGDPRPAASGRARRMGMSTGPPNPGAVTSGAARSGGVSGASRDRIPTRRGAEAPEPDGTPLSVSSSRSSSPRTDSSAALGVAVCWSARATGPDEPPGDRGGRAAARGSVRRLRARPGVALSSARSAPGRSRPAAARVTADPCRCPSIRIVHCTGFGPSEVDVPAPPDRHEHLQDARRCSARRRRAAGRPRSP